MESGSHRFNRRYKDRLFRMVFRDKRNALSLLNALGGTNFSNADELEVVTLEDAVYMGLKNDVAVLLGDDLTLFEHQSTPNPNMPLRGFLYFAATYQAYLADLESRDGQTLFDRSLVSVPAPAYYVMYNGSEEAPERQELKLSDSFGRPAQGFEWTATVVNINAGSSEALMGACPVLGSYSSFVAGLRGRRASGMPEGEAIAEVIDQFADDPYIGPILTKNRAEVTDVILSEFNEEAYRRSLKKWYEKQGLEKGMQQGIEQGIEQGRSEERKANIQTTLQSMRAEGLSDKQISNVLKGSFDLSEGELAELLAQV